jgi:hypothetical protein
VRVCVCLKEGSNEGRRRREDCVHVLNQGRQEGVDVCVYVCVCERHKRQEEMETDDEVQVCGNLCIGTQTNLRRNHMVVLCVCMCVCVCL